MIEKPRARRYPFAATVELVDMETGAELHAQTSDISSFGCRVNVSRWAPGTKVRVRIFHRGAVLSASGVIANMQIKGAMGVSFTQIDEKQQVVLENWLTEVRDTHEKASLRR